MRFSKALCFTVFAALTVLPALAVAEPMSSIARNEARRTFVSDMARDALSILHDSKKTYGDKQAILRQAFADNVDIAWISRFVVGRAWQTASEAERNHYIDLYGRYLTQSYVSKFEEGAEKKIRDIRILSVTEAEGENFNVRTEMLLADGNSINVTYLVRDHNDRYKVIDIIIENISLLASHRAQFSQVASEGGIVRVIAELEALTRPGTITLSMR